MNKYIILVAGFTLSLFLIWIALFTFTSIKECPEKLPSNNYACTNDNDCMFHPKYECINSETILNCIISEDLSKKQTAAPLLTCKCVNNVCETIVRH